MKALVLEAYDQFALRDVPVPEIKPSQVLVRVKACAICGSDVYGASGASGRRIPPVIMGHEASGVIVEVGRDVIGWEKGESVTFDSTEYCGCCKYCRRGEINLCDNRKVLGVSCREYRRNGAMAEYVAVEGRTLYRIPQGVSFAEAALAEPLSIGVHAVSISPLKLGDTVLVAGAGTIGLMVLQAAKAAGAGLTIVSDIDDARLCTAKEMGADITVNSSQNELPAFIKELTEGCGADIAFDAVGMEAATSSAIASLRKGGCIVCIGNAQPDMKLPFQEMVTRQIRLQGSCASAGEYDVCLGMIKQKQVCLGPVLKDRMPLEQGAEAFARLIIREPGLLKIILEP